VAENSRKDIEATSKVKQEELKQTLKQLEKEKVNVVELRYQLAEKDKNFTNILTDIEKTNQDISQKYD
jgi:Tfp pilus assembly protein PilO